MVTRFAKVGMARMRMRLARMRMMMKRMTMSHNLKVHTLATRALVSYPGSGNTWIRYLIGHMVTMIKGNNDCENHEHHDNH